MASLTNNILLRKLSLLKKFRKVMVLAVLFGGIAMARAQSTNEDKVKAVFIYNFTHFIKWPAASFDTESAPFIIGVMGGNIVPPLKETIEGEMYGTHPIQIRIIKDKKDVAGCHLLFIEGSDVSGIPAILDPLKNKPVLTVGDADSFMKDAGIIRLFNDDNKIRLEINAKKAEEAGLDISAKLLNLATLYDK